MKTILFLLLALPILASAADVELAYRNPNALSEGERRTVLLQGQRQDGYFHFDAACGTFGERCECLFYRSATDNEPLRSSSTSVSAPNNALSCVIPGDVTMPDMIRQVAVRLRTGGPVTDRVDIRTALTLDDVLAGVIDKNTVRGIFRYSCTRTFLEGEGVSEGSLACVPSQHLGVITAAYNFYTYRSGTGSNYPGGDIPFVADLCGRNSFLKVQCTGNTPELRFGFSGSQAGPFVVAVSLTTAPNGGTTEGFVALPDEGGHCPLGLVKARPWRAHPASILPGSLDGANPPTNFLNDNGQLDNTVVEIAPPPAMAVTRQANDIPCSATGDCSMASFGAATTAEMANYTPLTPVVCVIPPELLSGLF